MVSRHENDLAVTRYIQIICAIAKAADVKGGIGSGCGIDQVHADCGH